MGGWISAFAGMSAERHRPVSLRRLGVFRALPPIVMAGLVPAISVF